MKKFGLIMVAAASALILSACVSSGVEKDKDPAVGKGVTAWNSSKGPKSAAAYWEEIADPAKKKTYLNYVTLYEAGVDALDSTDGVKASNESKLLSACNTALNKFKELDPDLKLPEYVSKKGADLAAGRIDKLLASGKISEAEKMQKNAVKVYGSLHESLVASEKEVTLCKQINGKKEKIAAQAAKISEMNDFDEKVAAYDAILNQYNTEAAAVSSLIKTSEVGTMAGVAATEKAFRKVKQDIAVQRESVFRDEVYNYKEKIGEIFARELPEGTGSGRNGALTNQDILNHYNQVQSDIDATYEELLAFASKHKQDVGQDIIDDVSTQKQTLKEKIAQVNKEIAHEKEVASRGKTVMPLMIGLFNADPNSSASNKKSRPAKFSSKGAKKDEYWWGMVSIPKGQMNDLVITLKDNRTVRVFNQNTKSGKLIEKNNLQDLVSRSSRVGNSWPVLNAGAQLTGTNYYFEVQKGKTDSYSGEVVVYSSFITRMR